MAYDHIPAEARSAALRMVDDFEFFAARCLKIRSKSGEILPLKLNRGQKRLHERLEAMRKAGKPVRAIIVKGRQMGISTYLQARFYWLMWRCKRQKALNAFILTHDQAATDNLFGMAQRFHDMMPEALKPATAQSNVKTLQFAENGCAYHVATAGAREVGRSATIQLLHGSEVPSWPNAESHVVSLISTALAKGPGTEGILEATAKGVGNVFHRTWQGAVRGESEYEAIFIPWFWDDGYQKPCPSHWADSMPKAWHEYALAHALTFEQVYWAWDTNRILAQAKNLSFDEPCADFKQEYPATAEEAFQSSGNSFISAPLLVRARQKRSGADIIVGRGPVILGVDPARGAPVVAKGSGESSATNRTDKVGIIDRCGRVMGERICERMDPQGSVIYVAQRVARIIDRIRPDAVNIDVGGIGAGVVDWLLDQGYGHIVNAVNFGSNPIGRGPTGEEMYLNRRAEMYDLMRDWFGGELPVQIPDDDGLHADLSAAEWGAQACRYNSNNELVMEEKSKIIERLGASPDLGDAAALTFAVPFAQGMQAMNQPRPQRRTGRTGY